MKKNKKLKAKSKSIAKSKTPKIGDMVYCKRHKICALVIGTAEYLYQDPQYWIQYFKLDLPSEIMEKSEWVNIQQLEVR